LAVLLQKDVFEHQIEQDLVDGEVFYHEETFTGFFAYLEDIFTVDSGALVHQPQKLFKVLQECLANWRIFAKLVHIFSYFEKIGYFVVFSGL
jgi:hypothetical protein